MLSIGLTYDLRSEYLALGFREDQVAEFDSDATVDALEATLRDLGYRPVRIGHARSLCRRLVEGERWDLVFNIAEGIHGRGREAQVPALLELYDIPYTFSDTLVCAATLDKAVTKRLVRDAGLNTAAFAVIRSADEIKRVDLRYPLFAKPIAEGTGKGIDRNSRIDSSAALQTVCEALLHRHHQPVLVEEYLPGREFTVGILGTGEKARVLGTMEVNFRPHAQTLIYSYEMKEKCEDFITYTRLAEGPLKSAVTELALQSYRVLECRDAGRIDIRMDNADRPAFIEVNPLAGLHPQHSDLPILATQEGWSYRELIKAIVESALLRREPVHV
jgi:D-alanine-D-alanine ligase